MSRLNNKSSCPSYSCLQLHCPCAGLKYTFLGRDEIVSVYVISFSVIVTSLCCGYKRLYIFAKNSNYFMTEVAKENLSHFFAISGDILLH